MEGNGWANDWLIDFKNPDDEILWKVKIVNEGFYNLKIKLNSPDANIGSELFLNLVG